MWLLRPSSACGAVSLGSFFFAAPIGLEGLSIKCSSPFQCSHFGFLQSGQIIELVITNQGPFSACPHARAARPHTCDSRQVCVCVGVDVSDKATGAAQDQTNIHLS